MTIHYLPLERLEERYTGQMYRWVTVALKKIGHPFQFYLPEYQGGIDQGQWLDINKTCEFKSNQLAMIAKAFQEKRVKDGDIFLFGDLWFPGLEQIRFMAELSNLKVKIGGWHYAGMFDRYDMLAKKLGDWAVHWERNMLWMVDLVCCGSYFHKGFLSEAVPQIIDKLQVHGLAWDPEEVKAYAKPWTDREDIVVFPHRFADEKNPDAFRRLARYWKGSGHQPLRFVISSGKEFEVPGGWDPVEFVFHDSKKAYYEFLANCRWFYSAAHQETFGYALHEAIALGLSVIAPHRCSYPEMLNQDRTYLYDDKKDPNGFRLFAERVASPLPPPYQFTERFKNNTEAFIKELVKL